MGNGKAQTWLRLWIIAVTRARVARIISSGPYPYIHIGYKFLYRFGVCVCVIFFFLFSPLCGAYDNIIGFGRGIYRAKWRGEAELSWSSDIKAAGEQQYFTA